jgi:hypothetical protein
MTNAAVPAMPAALTTAALGSLAVGEMSIPKGGGGYGGEKVTPL